MRGLVALGVVLGIAACHKAPPEVRAPVDERPPAATYVSINRQGSVKLGGAVTVAMECSAFVDACGPALRDLQKLYAKHHEHGLVVLGLLVDDPPKDAAAKAQMRQLVSGLEFPVALDPNGGGDFRVKMLPETVVLDAKRNIRYRHQGREPGLAEALEAEARELLNERH